MSTKTGLRAALIADHGKRVDAYEDEDGGRLVVMVWANGPERNARWSGRRMDYPFRLQFHDRLEALGWLVTALAGDGFGEFRAEPKEATK